MSVSDPQATLGTTPLHPRERVIASSLPALSLSALGVVFGDIGTSPLYTLKTVLGLTGPHPDPIATLGALSLVILDAHCGDVDQIRIVRDAGRQ
jgi:hypothetical protein